MQRVEEMKENNINKKEKMNTPQYIRDIRNNLYSKEGAITKLLQEAGIESFPINVWSIARNLNFEVLEATFKNDNTSGMMIDALEVPRILEKFGCRRAIILNKNEKKSMQSFTIAHELGHFIFDCNDEENCFDAYHISREKQVGELTKEEQRKKDKEDQIDEFAAMLLMPETMFREFIVKSKNRYNRKKLMEEMARVCMVEETAVNKRFDELGIEFKC